MRHAAQLAMLWIAMAAVAPAQGLKAPVDPALFRGVGFQENLGGQIPLGLPFRDESGARVTLGSYFVDRPVVLTLVYYECPMLCSQELNALSRTLKAMEQTVGKEFEVVTVSISPTETPAQAAGRKALYLKKYDRPGADRGWHFLTGPESSIRKLADAAGFHYTYNPATKLYAHAAGLVLLTPGGKVARYVQGISYPARDLRVALEQAKAGRISEPVKQLMLLCFEYDPRTGKYSIYVMGLVRVLGLATVAGLGSYLALMLIRDRRAARSDSPPPDNLEAPLG